MSDIQLKTEITQLVNNSGYPKSKSLLCPLMRIVSMRHKNVPLKRIYEAVNSVI